jgi:fumarylacetoacetate (FAA) hydrolase
MRLGTLRTGGRDGTLVVVGSGTGTGASRPAPATRDEGDPAASGPLRFARATSVAPTLQAALDDWPRASLALRELAARLDEGDLPAETAGPEAFAAPLPRAYEWLDGSAFLSHVRLARRARGAEPPADLLTSPLVYQGGSGVLLGARDPIALGDPDYGLDFEAELGVILGDVAQGTLAPGAAPAVRLVCLLNDITLRNLVPGELAKGFGFLQSKPSTAFAPLVITPDELGDSWRDGRVHLPVRCFVNDRLVGRCHAGEMFFSFHDLVAHVARTRGLTAGTILGSGTISNDDAVHGVSCLVEARMRETLASGAATTPYLRPGDLVRIEVLDPVGRNLFGSIIQEVRAP